MREVEGRPGVFVLNSKEDEYGSYRCILMNELFCEITEINTISGWQMETSYIYVDTKIQDPEHFHEGDVQVLAQIVRNSNNPDLVAWWNDGDWKEEFAGDANAWVTWNNENPRRLTRVAIWDTPVGESVNVAALDQLKELDLSNYSADSRNLLKTVLLPNNPDSLRYINVSGNLNLKALNVTPYVNLNSFAIAC